MLFQITLNWCTSGEICNRGTVGQEMNEPFVSSSDADGGMAGKQAEKPEVANREPNSFWTPSRSTLPWGTPGGPLPTYSFISFPTFSNFEYYVSLNGSFST